MQSPVLIIDKDIERVREINQKAAIYEDDFALLHVQDGDVAITKLRNNHITIVILGSAQGKTRDFDLFAYIKDNFPDISVIAIANPTYDVSKKKTLKRNAFAFLKNDATPHIIVQSITEAIEKESENGKLHNVSLEMFTQMVEMEQKTCTIHVHKGKLLKGILFFKDGNLINARIGHLKGIKIAYEIFSWTAVTLSIEGKCPEKQAIDKTLQSILFESMRIRDERNAKNKKTDAVAAPPKTKTNTVAEPGPDIQKPSQAKVSTPPQKTANKKKSPARKKPMGTKPAARATTSKKAKQVTNSTPQVRKSSEWDYLLDHVNKIGIFFNIGKIISVSLETESGKQNVITPEEKSNEVIPAEKPIITAAKLSKPSRSQKDGTPEIIPKYSKSKSKNKQKGTVTQINTGVFETIDKKTDLKNQQKKDDVVDKPVLKSKSKKKKSQVTVNVRSDLLNGYKSKKSKAKGKQKPATKVKNSPKIKMNKDAIKNL